MPRRKIYNYRIGTVELIAKKWGVKAPYPTLQLMDRYRKWKGYEQRIFNLKFDAAKPDCKRRQSMHLEIQRCVRMRDKLKLPAPYLCWHHVGAFEDAYWARQGNQT